MFDKVNSRYGGGVAVDDMETDYLVIALQR